MYSHNSTSREPFDSTRYKNDTSYPIRITDSGYNSPNNTRTAASIAESDQQELNALIAQNNIVERVLADRARNKKKEKARQRERRQDCVLVGNFTFPYHNNGVFLPTAEADQRNVDNLRSTEDRRHSSRVLDKTSTQTSTTDATFAETSFPKAPTHRPSIFDALRWNRRQKQKGLSKSSDADSMCPPKTERLPKLAMPKVTLQSLRRLISFRNPTPDAKATPCPARPAPQPTKSHTVDPTFKIPHKPSSKASTTFSAIRRNDAYLRHKNTPSSGVTPRLDLVVKPLPAIPDLSPYNSNTQDSTAIDRGPPPNQSTHVKVPERRGALHSSLRAISKIIRPKTRSPEPKDASKQTETRTKSSETDDTTKQATPLPAVEQERTTAVRRMWKRVKNALSFKSSRVGISL